MTACPCNFCNFVTTATATWATFPSGGLLSTLGPMELKTENFGQGFQMLQGFPNGSFSVKTKQLRPKPANRKKQLLIIIACMLNILKASAIKHWLNQTVRSHSRMFHMQHQSGKIMLNPCPVYQLCQCSLGLLHIFNLSKLGFNQPMGRDANMTTPSTWPWDQARPMSKQPIHMGAPMNQPWWAPGTDEAPLAKVHKVCSLVQSWTFCILLLLWVWFLKLPVACWKAVVPHNLLATSATCTKHDHSSQQTLETKLHPFRNRYASRAPLSLYRWLGRKPQSPGIGYHFQNLFAATFKRI